MKLLIISLMFTMCANFLHATHRNDIDANNIETGTLSNARLSVNVTTQGQLNDGSKVLIISSATSYGTITSTSGFIGVGSSLTLLNASNLVSGVILNARLDPSSVTLQGQNVVNLGVSTQTKNAGLILNGNITANNGIFTNVSGDGSGITNIGGFVTLTATQTFTGIVNISTSLGSTFSSANPDSHLRVQGSMYLTSYSSNSTLTYSGCAGLAPTNLNLGIDDNLNTVSGTAVTGIPTGCSFILDIGTKRQGISYLDFDFETSATGFLYEVDASTSGTSNSFQSKIISTTTVSGTGPSQRHSVAFPFNAQRLRFTFYDDQANGIPGIGIREWRVKLYE